MSNENTTGPVPAEVANRAINDALQFTATPGAALSPDYAELRKLAEAATPGPWRSQGRHIGTMNHASFIGECRDQNGNWSDTAKSTGDSAFIAAANPTAILSLLDAIKELEHQVWCADVNADGKAEQHAEELRDAIASRPAAHVSAPTELTKRLRDIARGERPLTTGALPELLVQAAEEIERYYGGMMAWKKTSSKKDADYNDERMARINDRLAAQPAPVSAQVSDELLSAADAVVERWHSKDWKQPHTAEFINRLSAAVGAVKFATPVAVAPSPAGESLSAGHSAKAWHSQANALTAENMQLRERLKLIEQHRSADTWYWQGDAGDSLETMGNAMAVVIRADQLRALATHRQPEDGRTDDQREQDHLDSLAQDDAAELWKSQPEDGAAQAGGLSDDLIQQILRLPYEPADNPSSLYQVGHAQGHGHGIGAVVNFLRTPSATATKEASVQGVPCWTDDQMIGVLHSLRIDTKLSAYGFDALQVSGTNVPGMKAIVQKCIDCIQSGAWPVPRYCFDNDGNVVRAPSAPQGESK